jgi:hypothetical protein
MGKTRDSANLVSDNNIVVDIVNDRVGIGSRIPAFDLDVSGDINFTGTLNQNGSQFVASRWTSGTGNDIYRLNGDVGIGTTNPQFNLDVVGNINFTGTLNQNGSQFVASRWSSGTGNDIYRLNGDVGIGTTNPTSKLQVLGDVTISGIITASNASISGVVTATTYYGDGSNLSNLETGTDITSSLFS